MSNILQLHQQTGTADPTSLLYAATNGTTDTALPLSLIQSSFPFTQAGTGTITRTLSSKLQDTVDVLDFGADPTGVLDSTTAFINALSTGKTVNFKGTYTISGIALQSGWRLQGVDRANSQLLLKAGANQHMFFGTNVNDIVLKDFYANGNKANQSLGSANPWRGIYLNGSCARIRIDNVQVDQCQDHGISLNDTNTPLQCGIDSLIINTTATNCGSAAHTSAGGPGGTGIGGGALSLTIIGCLSQSNYLNGFKSPSGTYINCFSTLNGGGFETGFSTPVESNINLIGCRAYNNLGSGYRHQGQGQQILMLGCSAVGNAYSGVDALGNVNGLSIIGGYYFNNGTNGTRITGTSGLDGISLHGEGSAGPSNVIVSGVQFFDNQGAPTQQYALYTTVLTNNVAFDSSNIVGTQATGAVFMDATSASNNLRIGNFIGNQTITRLQSSVASSGTTTFTLATMTAPANTIVTGSVMRVKASGRVTGTVGTKIIRLQVGSTSVIFSNQTAAQTNPWVLEATIPIGANASRTINVLSPTASQTAVSFSTGSTLTTLINCTCAGGDVVTLDAFEVTFE